MIETDDSRSQLLERTVLEAAASLDGAPEPLVEKDLEEALEASLKVAATAVRRQQPVKLESWHGALGAADLGIESDGAPDLIEAKWGGSALWNCAWDTAKLATALAEGVARSSYLIAGAARADWDGRAEGSELFDTGPWSLEDLLHRYSRRFAFWRTDIKNRPLRLADRWWVVQHEGAELEVVGQVYEIRLAEIVAVEPALVPIAYAPRIADWTPSYRAREPAEGRRLDPDAVESKAKLRAESVERASRISGSLARFGAGEGFSVHLASAHFLATDEGTMRDFADEGTSADLAEKPVTLRRFPSPGARRAWLASRRQIRPNEPELFMVVTGSGLGDESKVLWRDGTLRYAYRGTPELAGGKSLRPSAESWARLWPELDRIGIWDWLPDYQPSVMSTDGYFWELAIAQTGRMVRSKGYNAFPDRGSVSDEITPEWGALLRALRGLMGGLPVA